MRRKLSGKGEEREKKKKIHPKPTQASSGKGRGEKKKRKKKNNNNKPHRAPLNKTNFFHFSAGDGRKVSVRGRADGRAALPLPAALLPRRTPGQRPARPGPARPSPPPLPAHPVGPCPPAAPPSGTVSLKRGSPGRSGRLSPPSCPAPPSGAAAAALPARLKRQRPRGRGSPPGRGGAAPPRGLTGSPRGRPPPALPGRIPRPGPAVRCASGPRRSPLFIRRRCRSPRCPQPGAPSRPPRSGGYGEREPRRARPDGCSRRSGSRRVTRAVPVIASLWLLITIFNEMQLFLFFFFPGQFRHYPVWCRGTTAPLASAS